MKLRKDFLLLVLAMLISTSLYASEGDTYSFSWLDPDKEVYVLQNRKYRKRGKLHANVGYGYTTSGAFVTASALQGRVGFFFTEDWGFEAFYSSNSGEENDTAKSVRNDGAAGSIPFRRIVDSYYGGMLMWSPFYSKINTFNTIFYFDWLLGVGFGKLTESNNSSEFLNGGSSNSNPDQQQEHSAGFWQAAIKFYVSESFDVRLNLLGAYYNAKRPSTNASRNEDTLYSNYDLSVTFGMSF